MDPDEAFFEKVNPALRSFYDAPEVLTNDEPAKLNSLLPEPRYRDEAFIAEGAMKEVYAITDTHSDRRVAIARLKKSLISSEQIESFVREAQLTALLQHPNIIRLYDVGVEKGRPWFTMELISGQSLQDLIDEWSGGAEPWLLNQKLDLFIKVCDAVAYAHAQEVLHLDIKPSNIRLGHYGEVLLCDWGLSHQLSCQLTGMMTDLKNAQTLHGYLKGTPGYMAPEQATEGYVKHPTSDVFGLGALLYCLLTNRPPFAGDDVAEVLESTRGGKFSSPSLHSIIPSGLFAAIDKSLAVRMEDRYSRVAELRDEVQRFREGFATSAEEASLWKQVRLFYQRNRVLCSTVLFFSLVLVGVSIWFIQSLTVSERQALNAKDDAQKALVRVKQEKRETLLVNRQLSQVLIMQNRVNLDDFNFDQALKQVSEAVERDPENMEALMQKGFNHFIRQEFSQARECFGRSGQSEEEDLYRLSVKYAKGKKPVTATTMVKLLAELPSKRTQLRLYILKYDSRTNPSLSEHSKLVKHMIEARNQLKNIQFKYDERERSLDLSGNKKVVTLRSAPVRFIKDFCLLQGLKLWKLDLSGTRIAELSQLSGLKLRELNLRGTSVRDLRPLLAMTSLQSVTLSPQQRHLIGKKAWPFVIVVEK